MSKNFYPTKIHDQNFWELASIQSAAQGLTNIILGGQLGKEYGNGTALISVCIGNLFLWLIGLSIISMTLQSRKNAIENVRTYLGKTGGIFAAIILMVAFLNWYIIQINITTSSIEHFFSEYESNWKIGITIRIGATLGLITALLSMGGIRFIKWICVICLPFFFFYVIYTYFAFYKDITFSGTWGFSLAATILSITLTLPGIINLPTFFRHSRSRADSFLALTIFTCFTIFFEAFGIFMGISIPSDFFDFETSTHVVITFAFVILFLLCVNLVNIYFASAGWEMIIPHVWSAKEYAIVGLLGTAAYTFLQISKPMIFLEHVAESFISSLGIVLLMTFLMKIIVKHRLRNFEKTISGFCWLIGCLTSLYLLTYSTKDPSQVLIAGILASSISFLIVIFIEETKWSLHSVITSYVNFKGVNGK